MCSSVCLQAQKKNTAQKCMVISLVNESTVVFFLHFLNIQDVLECIYDFYNQKKNVFENGKVCLRPESHVPIFPLINMLRLSRFIHVGLAGSTLKIKVFYK